MNHTIWAFFAAVVAGVSAAGCGCNGSDANCDVADLIIRGKARRAAELCEYPLRINITPSPDIQNKKDFIKWFPVVFDKEARRKLRELRDAGKWWDGDSGRSHAFGNGELWSDFFHDDSARKLYVVNLISPSLFKWWKGEFQKDLMTLAPQYLEDCVWPAFYFMSEDEEYFGRVDALGEKNAWTIEDGVGVYAGTLVSERFRVMLFRRGQKTSEAPWMVFNYDAKDDPKYGNRHAGEIESEKEDFVFLKFTVGNDDTPEMLLEYGMRTGKETALRLKHTAWPPPNAANQ